jgi:Ca2+-binding EF-hand superfamily protein
MFDSSKAGKIENEKVRTILNTLGLAINDLELEALLEEEDKEGNVQELKTGLPSRSAAAYIQDVSKILGRISSASS